MSKNKIRSLSGSHGCLSMGSKDFWSAEKGLTRSCHWGKSINRKIPFSLSLSIESELNFSFTSTFPGSHGLSKLTFSG